MGSWNKYDCPNCDYSATVSGGRDGGMVAVVETMTCMDCKELFDISIGFQGTVGPSGKPDVDKDMNKCPECRGENLKKWTRRAPCPKCGKKMISDDTVDILWD